MVGWVIPASLKTHDSYLLNHTHAHTHAHWGFSGIQKKILSTQCCHIFYTMGPGPGLVARVLWLYCMQLASSGVGGVRRVQLALLYVGSCVGVLLWMFWMRLESSDIRCGGGASGAIRRRLAAPVAHPQHPMTLAACNTATRHVPPALALTP